MDARKNFEYLSGPISWYEYEFKDDNGNKKMIHLFGDRHDLKTLCDESLNCMKNASSPKSDCYEFVYFLKELFDIVVYNQQYADFFLEFRYNIHKQNIYQSNQSYTIGKVFTQFQDCLQYTKKDCKYLPYIRMHYTDLRDAFLGSDYTDKNSSFTDLLFDIYSKLVSNLSDRPSIEDHIRTINMIDQLLLIVKNYCKFYKIFLDSKNFTEDFSDFIEPYLKVFNENPNLFHPEDVDHFLNVVKLLKKLKHPKSNYSIIGYQIGELKKDEIIVNGKNIADLIYPFIEKKCINIVDHFNGIFKKWTDISDKIIKFGQNMPRNILDDLLKFKDQIQAGGVALNSYILDGYILPRLFRSFSTSGKPHQPSILSIVYAGNFHIQTEIEFLNDVLQLKPIHQVNPELIKEKKKTDYLIKNLTTQCLHSKSFKDIFSHFKELPSKGKEEYFNELINTKNFDFIYQGEEGILVKPKELGPFCELFPELEICSQNEDEDVKDYYIWIDNDNQMVTFNLNDGLYRDENNDEVSPNKLNKLRKEIPVIDKIFKEYEYGLLNPGKRDKLKYQANPKLYAVILMTYIQSVLGHRWKEAEEHILKNPEQVVNYAIYILKQRWPDETLSTGENLREKAENIILNGSTVYARKYFEKFGLETKGIIPEPEEEESSDDEGYL